MHLIVRRTLLRFMRFMRFHIAYQSVFAAESQNRVNRSRTWLESKIGVYNVDCASMSRNNQHDSFRTLIVNRSCYAHVINIPEVDRLRAEEGKRADLDGK